MPDGTESVLRLLVQGLPEETDAPEDVGPAYDPGLLVELEEHGPDALEEYGQIVVRGVGDAARYNAALWYALAYDLAYEHRGDVVVITDPRAA